MRHQKYSTSPRNVRLYAHQDELLTEMLNNKEYCMKKGYFSVSDIFRNLLLSEQKNYEQYSVRQQIGV